ncbi:MAG: ATP-binding domain-containing protein [Proteobacteria bacterium]|nr:ATP-binding domain-containing protein [Pseudomonadota bacterium]
MARPGHNKQFEFTAGVTITNLLQIKGLEFDSVILMDPSEQNYPNNVQGCKHLYTAITRAKEQLHMIGSCTPTPILDSGIKESILLINQKGNS